MFKITPHIKREIIEIIDERVKGVHVTKEDFSELKAIVQNLGINVGELAIAQKKTEARVSELASAQKETQKDVGRLDKTMQELAEAQKRTEARVSELASAQKRTETKVEELASAQKETEARVSELASAQKETEARVSELASAQKRTEIEIQGLTKGLKLTREDLGGLSRSFSYSFENEAYRMLPGFLKDTYGIEMTEKIIRKEIGGKEINIFGKAKRNGTNLLIVGEAKLRLEKKRDEKKDIFKELEEKAKVIKKISQEEIVKILITHYAPEKIIKEAKQRGIIVIQSFEW